MATIHKHQSLEGDLVLEGDYSQGFSFFESGKYSKGLRVMWRREWSFLHDCFMHRMTFNANNKIMYSRVLARHGASDYWVKGKLMESVIRHLTNQGCTLNGCLA